MQSDAGSEKFFSDMERLIAENKQLKGTIEEQDVIIKDLQKLRDDIMKDAYRTMDLNNRLADSETQLKSLLAQKDKFFSIIAHDLRNPIGNFKELTAVLVDNFDTMELSELREFIFELAKTSKHLYSLLENLLEWSRSQLGKIQFEPVNCNLAQMVDINIGLLELSAKNKNIKIIIEVDNKIVGYFDINTINTVIRNLLSNAIKFTDKGGIIQFLSDQNDEFVILKIKDNGVGIETENIPKLFRVDEYTSTIGTNQEKGTGLGLVLCKEFVEKNNGNIRVESKVGEGTCFIISLPKYNKDLLLPSEYISPYAINQNDLYEVENEFKIKVEPELESKLNEIIDFLENKLLLKYQDAHETMVISSITTFANTLKEYAESMNFKFLVDYSNELLSYVEELEIDLLGKNLERFPEIITELKTLLN